MSEDAQLTPEQFVIRAIETLRNPEKSKGIHTVFSGFNEAFRKYFSGQDPVAATNQLAQEGKIAIRYVRGGAMIYKPEDAPAPRGGAGQALRKMGLDEPH
jgi:hypothetical protein